MITGFQLVWCGGVALLPLVLVYSIVPSIWLQTLVSGEGVVLLKMAADRCISTSIHGRTGRPRGSRKRNQANAHSNRGTGTVSEDETIDQQELTDRQSELTQDQPSATDSQGATDITRTQSGSLSQNSTDSSQASGGPPQLPLDIVQEYCPLPGPSTGAVDESTLLNLSQESLSSPDAEVLKILQFPSKRQKRAKVSPVGSTVVSGAAMTSTSAPRPKPSSSFDLGRMTSGRMTSGRISRLATANVSRCDSEPLPSDATRLGSSTLPLFVEQMSLSPLVSPKLSSSSTSSGSQDHVTSPPAGIALNIKTGEPTRRVSARKRKAQVGLLTIDDKVLYPTEGQSPTISDDTPPFGTYADSQSTRKFTRMDQRSDAQKERRRAQNRHAAQRSRQKKREVSQSLVKDYQRMQCANTNLRFQISRLQKERNSLASALREHMKTCDVQVPSRLLPSLSIPKQALSVPAICLASNVVSSVIHRQSRPSVTSTVTSATQRKEASFGDLDLKQQWISSITPDKPPETSFEIHAESVATSSTARMRQSDTHPTSSSSQSHGCQGHRA